MTVFVLFFCRVNEHYLLSYYLKPHTRYGPFLIGILIGIYLKTRKAPLLKQKVRTFEFQPQHNILITNLAAVTPVWFSCCAVVPVAGSTRLAPLFLTHGCASRISLLSQGDPTLSVCATRPLPGAAQMSLGSGCVLDHTGM